MSMQFKNKERLTRLFVFAASLSFYAYHLRDIFFRLNQILSGTTSDTIKNYFTFLYHAKNDSSLLTFSGMNYPFSEHVVYTDCQPLISGILHYLPFTHNYLVGILHGLLIFSFVISANILYAIFRRASVERFISACSALAIAFLAPQFLKISAGHFGLAYGCMIPLCLYFTQSYFVGTNKIRALTVLFSYHFLVFLIHPYMGMVLGLFSFLSLCASLLVVDCSRKLRHIFHAAIAGLLPILCFQILMKLTDTHLERTTKPYGGEEMVENISSLIAPDFGPFRASLEWIAGEKPGHFEGHSYLGLVTLLLVFVFLFIAFFRRKQVQLQHPYTAFLLASILILGISFGWHQKALSALGIESAAVNQFRAVCRFAWVFYYVLPVFLVIELYRSTQYWIAVNYAKALAVLFLVLNAVESGAMIHFNEAAFWKFRNFFNAKLMTDKEHKLLEIIAAQHAQALIPFPIFHGGSELYERNGFSTSMAPSMMYSFHTGLPLLSVMMSRTSLNETEDLINFLNPYKKNREALSLLSNQNFIVLKTQDPLLPDEERLLPQSRLLAQHDSIEFRSLPYDALLHSKLKGTSIDLRLPSDSLRAKHVLYIDSASYSPYLTTATNKLAKMFQVDSLSLPSGRYVLSFHYHFKNRKLENFTPNIIPTQHLNGSFVWLDLLSLRKFSGFYEGYNVYENFVDMNQHATYEFLLQGFEGGEYYVSNVLLRPDTLNCRIVVGRDTILNNFPQY